MTLEIFCPFWGDPDLLFEAVDSVRAQTDPHWRLIVIDDCYPDASVAERFAAIDDDRVVYVRNEKNVGITENFRESARRATTDRIAIMGCDDRLQPNYVELMRRMIRENPDADVIQPGVLVIDEHGAGSSPLVDRVKQGLLAPKTKGATVVLTAEAMATSLIRGDWLYFPSLVFRTRTLRRIDFRPGLAVIQDLALLMDIAFDGGSLAYTPAIAFCYRRHSSSASQTTLLDGRRFTDERRYYGTARAIALGLGWKRTARVARARLMSRLHAVTVLPLVLRRGDRAALRAALAHIFAI